ncbi:MAG: hypothetical protein FJ293_11685 [Planctomycetes bacterium]|nr:hypothetical protein [Planctomycetota bacterium]
MRRYDFALLGFGNVGRALALHWQERRAAVAAELGIELALTAIVDRGAALHDATNLPVAALAKFKQDYGALAAWPGIGPALRPDELRARGVEGVVISLPTDLATGQPGLGWARAALDCGLDVILADKGPALHALPELEESAALAGASIGTSATTGSALPSLDVLRTWFGAARVTAIRAVLNGTSNLILTRLRQPGANYASALAEAQRAGIAEPDPRLDVEGYDTAIKLLILTRGLIDPTLTWDAVERRGITDLPPGAVAAAQGGPERLRLIGRAWRDGGRTRIVVTPELVAPGDPFHALDGAEKAVTFRSDDLGELTVSGGASSRTGTASALLRDLIAAAAART